MTDQDLLQRYVKSRDQEAFREIAARYAGVVYAAALRQLATREEAEDAAQAVFVVLAKRAHTIRNGRILAAWLLKVTGYVVLNARRARRRRDKYEQGVAAMRSEVLPPPTDAEQSEMTTMLDTLLGKLSAEDRAALVLRYFRDQSHSQIAAEFALTEDATKKRISRALEKLRTLFTRRGVIVPTAILAAVLTKQTLAAPPTLALTCAAAGAGTVSTTTVAFTLANGAMKLMTTAKLAVTAAAAVVIIAAAGTVGVAAALHHAPPPVPIFADAITPQITPPPANANFQKVLPPPTGTVQDAAGNPIPNATVKLFHDAGRSGLDNTLLESVQTDAQGKFKFTHTLGFETLTALESSDHYLLLASDPTHALAWHTLFSNGEQAQYHLRLTTPVTQEFSIVDESNNPIAGANIALMLANVPPEARSTDPADNLRLVVHGDGTPPLATSDAKGDVQLSSLPASTVAFVIRKEGYANQTVLPAPAGSLPPVVIMHKESHITGRVLDPQNNPVANTFVLLKAVDTDSAVETRTDAEGKFSATVMPSSALYPNFHGKDLWRVTIESPDLITEPQTVHIQEGETTPNVELKAVPGTLVTGSVIDADSKPIPGVTLGITVNRDYQYPVQAATDSQGRFSFRTFPGQLNIRVDGTMGGTFLLNSYQVGTQLSVSPNQKEAKAQLHITKPIGTLCTIRGHATLPDGSPAIGLKIQPAETTDILMTSHFFNSGPAAATTADDGSFTLDDVPQGQKISLYTNTKDRKFGALLTVDVDPAADNLDLHLQPTFSIPVLIKDEHGEPLPSQKIKINIRSDSGWSIGSLKTITTDAQGHAKITGALPNVTYELEGSGGNQHDWSVPLAFTGPQTEPLPIIYSALVPIRVTGPDGKTVNIQKVFELEIGNWRMRFEPPIAGRLDDGSILLDRDNLQINHAYANCTLKFTDAAGHRGIAECTFPPNASRLDMQFKTLTGAVEDSTVPANAAPYEIAGIITDTQNNPLPNARISFPLHNPFHPDTIQPVTTGPDGTFRIHLTEKEWFLYMQVDAPNYATRWILDSRKGKPFAVRMDNTTHLKGQLLSADGKPAPNQTLTLVTSQPLPGEDDDFKLDDLQTDIKTDGEGRFDALVDPSTYEIQVRGPDGVFARLTNIEVAKGATITKDVRLAAGPALHIRALDTVTGKPAPGVKMYIVRHYPRMLSMEENSERTTDADGRATWDHLLPGATELEIKSQSYVRWGMDGVAPDWEPDGLGINAIRFDLTPSTPDKTIRLEPGMQLTGKLLDQNNQPVKGLLINVAGLSTGDQRYARITDSDGSFSLTIPTTMGNGTNLYHLFAVKPDAPYPQPELAHSEDFQPEIAAKKQFTLHLGDAPTTNPSSQP